MIENQCTSRKHREPKNSLVTLEHFRSTSHPLKTNQATTWHKRAPILTACIYGLWPRHGQFANQHQPHAWQASCVIVNYIQLASSAAVEGG